MKTEGKCTAQSGPAACSPTPLLNVGSRFSYLWGFSDRNELAGTFQKYGPLLQH